MKTSAEEIQKDVDAIFWSLRLHRIRRFFHQRFWELETKEAEYADRIESWPKLESVSEHSWHVADTVLLLCPYFEQLNQRRCLELAILHDKLEIITGDANPVGRNGQGTTTHAFNAIKREEKDTEAMSALDTYASILRPQAAQEQRSLLEEIIRGDSAESHFVKSIDKLQALAFVMTKKRGDFQDKHLSFTLQYVERGIAGFPGLWRHYLEMRGRLLREVAKYRDRPEAAIEGVLGLNEKQLPFDEQQQWMCDET